MKRILHLGIALLLCVTAATAQPILTAANSNPVPGDVYYGHFIDTNVTAGMPGANITWDFSTATEIGLDTTTVFTCDSTPYCSSFPGSNIAELNGTDYMYMNAGASKLSTTGIRTSGINIWFSNTWDIMSYPLSYHSIFVDTSAAAVASLGAYHSEIDSYIYDGYGKVILPSGTDTGVARIHVITYSHDSSLAMGVQDSRVETYNWYVPGSHYTLVTVTYDTAGSATGTPYVSGATYYVMPRNTTGITNVNARITGATAYPNPAASELHIAFNLPNVAGASITITNLVGSVVETIDASQMKEGANDITVPVSNLPTGLYLVRIQNGVSEVSQKVVINH